METQTRSITITKERQNFGKICNLQIVNMNFFILDKNHIIRFSRYLIPEAENKKLKNLANKFEDRRKCDFPIRHKYFLIRPSPLKKSGIQFARVSVQLNSENLKQFLTEM